MDTGSQKVWRTTGIIVAFLGIGILVRVLWVAVMN
jgi:hypothetical protein